MHTVTQIINDRHRADLISKHREHEYVIVNDQFFVVYEPNIQLRGKGELREKLAAIEHQRWADWQQWCHDILREHIPSPELEKVLARWDRQINTDYQDLTIEEKQSDMDQVDRYWPLIEKFIEDRVRDAKN